MRRVSFVVLLLGGCAFNPDLSRFPPCSESGACPTVSSCLTEEQRCVPACGERASSGMSRASRTVMKPAPLLLLSPLTTTKGFSLMPYSLYLRRTLVSSAST